MTKRSNIHTATVDRKRSLAAKKGAVTRARNRALAEKRRVRLHYKIFAGAAIAVVVAFTAWGIYDQLSTFAASAYGVTFTGLANKCLDNRYSHHNDHNPIQLYRCNGTNAQKWTLGSDGSIKNIGTDYCIDIPGASHAPYTFTQLYHCNGTNAQKFTVANDKIVSRLTGYCVTVPFGRTANDTRLWVVPCNWSASQHWSTSGTSANVPAQSSYTTPPSAPAHASSSGNVSNGVQYGTVAHPFAANSPWNTPLPANPAIDPNSGAISRNVLTNNQLVVNLAIYGYGQPVYVSNSSTPYATLGGRASHFTMPLDPSWRPNTGGDYKMNVFDTRTGYSYELDGYNAASQSAYWAVKHSYVTGLGDGYPPAGELTGPTGSGMTQLGGMIRISDLESGQIDHALSFITSDPQQGAYRYPASGTDGTRTAPNGIQEGMRIQLDPSLNVDALPGITPGEKMIAKALQKYGAYCVDTGGGNDMAMGFYAEKPTTSNNPYPSVGFTSDWAQLTHIPRSAYRVIDASVTRRP